MPEAFICAQKSTKLQLKMRTIRSLNKSCILEVLNQEPNELRIVSAIAKYFGEDIEFVLNHFEVCN